MNSPQFAKLKTYFKNRDDVLMAFLFGSQAKGIGTKRSDWDIGVYLKPKSGRLEWERDEQDYHQKNEIWDDLTGILKTDNVDLIVLNQIPARMADIAIRGKPIIVKDALLYRQFMLLITNEAIDYRCMVDEYYEIFQRSKSLSRLDQELLKERIIYLENELADFSIYKKYDQQRYMHDREAKRSVERWVQNLVNCGLDISKTVLASQHRDVPQTYKRIFLHLQFIDGFSEALSKKLANWADLRNFLAHEYLDLRWNKEIKPFIDESQPYFNKFLKAVKKYLK